MDKENIGSTNQNIKTTTVVRVIHFKKIWLIRFMLSEGSHEDHREVGGESETEEWTDQSGIPMIK